MGFFLHRVHEKDYGNVLHGILYEISGGVFLEVFLMLSQLYLFVIIFKRRLLIKENHSTQRTFISCAFTHGEHERDYMHDQLSNDHRKKTRVVAIQMEF